MKTAELSHFPATRWFYLFTSLHLILWTLVPLLVRYNLPLDSIEGAIWGHQLEWGYDKNPFLNGWLTALAIYLGGPSGWMIYLFSQLSVVICFWAVWQLARNILSEALALISVMLLECIQYVNFHAIDFNDNTLELGLWALMSYCFYLALKKKKDQTIKHQTIKYGSPSHSMLSGTGVPPLALHTIRGRDILQTWNGSGFQRETLTWLLIGILAGFAMMAKYYTGALLVSMATFLLVLPNNRKQLKTLPPYLGLCAFLIIILPHTIWLFFNDFITIRYALFRASSLPSWLNHFYFPSQFAWQQFIVFFPAVILFALLFIGKKPLIAKSVYEDPTDKLFLLIVGLGPFILTLIVSLFFGIKLHAGWGMPLESLWGILLVASITPVLTHRKMYLFIATIFLLIVAEIFAYSLSLIYSSTESSANFPGKYFAEIITKEWHKNYDTKLSYVAGSRFVSGNIAFYSKDHPAVFIDWNKQRSPWINLLDLKQKGAVFVWEISHHKILPAEIRRQFPKLENFTLFELPWLRNNQLPPIKIGMAMLPPSSTLQARVKFKKQPGLNFKNKFNPGY